MATNPDQHLKDRATALAALFQAATLVEEIANTGKAPVRAFNTSVNSLFALDAESVDAIYADAAGLKTGRDFLRQVLERETGRDSANRVGYVMAILHLTGILRSDNAMQEIIRTRLGQIAPVTTGNPEHTADHIPDDVISKIAALYVDTFGTLGYRVQVKGDPRQLQVPDVAARIRTVLLAGVRAAHLWHHLGGRRWHLLLGAGKILEAL